MASLLTAATAALDGLPVSVTRLALVLLGLKVGRALYDAASFVAIYLRPSQLHRYIYPDAQGNPPWALVTGASDGVGVAFSDELAAAGLNVILHGRNEAKLEDVRQKLAAKHPQREFRLLVADATRVCQPAGAAGLTGSSSTSSPDAAINTYEIDRLVETHLAGLHLTVLINNAGGGLTTPTYNSLADTASHRIVDNVVLNAVFPMLLTARTLALFQRRRAEVVSPPGRSSPALIMNIGSLADNGLPFVTCYGASKVFMMAATGMVRRELDALGQSGDVQIMAVRFGVVTGVSHTQTPPRFGEPDTTTMARAALARTGSGRDVVVGYYEHAILNIIMAIMPGPLRERIFKNLMLTRRNKEIEQMTQQKKAT